MAAGLAECVNAVLLPHLGSATTETRARMSELVAANVDRRARRPRPPNLVNPEAWTDPGASPSAP